MKKQNWLTHQIFPTTDRYWEWLKTPIGWLLVAALGCVLVASTLAPQMWLVFAILITLMVMGVLWPMVAMWAISCEIKFDRKRCNEDQEIRVRLLITNRIWFPVWGLTLEKGFFRKLDDADDSEVAIALARIPAAATTEFVWDFAPKHRGIYPLVEPELSCGFPFGLWFSRKKITVSDQLIVWPETFRLGFIPPAKGRNQLVSETHTDQSGTVGDRIGVRPYQEGDSLRLIRWPQSARFDQLIVSEQQSPSRQLVTIIIDPFVGDENDEIVDPSTEDCLRIGASICAEFHAHGYLVHCLLGNDSLVIDARGSSFRSFMDHLAGIQLNQQFKDPTDSRTVETGACFAITNSELSYAASLPSSHLILIDGQEDDPVESSVNPPTAWIQVDAGVELKSAFPRKWIQSCHSSWQVSG